MTCKEAQSMVREYIAGELPPKELERFIEHVRGCGNCYEELETFFMIDRAVRYLDEETEHSFNLKTLLEKDLKEREHALARKRRSKWAIICLAVLVIVLMCLLLLDAFGIFQISRLF